MKERKVERKGSNLKSLAVVVEVVETSTNDQIKMLRDSGLTSDLADVHPSKLCVPNQLIEPDQFTSQSRRPLTLTPHLQAHFTHHSYSR